MAIVLDVMHYIFLATFVGFVVFVMVLMARKSE